MMVLHLTKGMVALVDKADWEIVSRYMWQASDSHGRFYACSTIGGKKVYLHRFLMQPPHGLVVDHINGSTLDNRRENMRVCSQAENARNARHHRRLNASSKFRGVHKLPYIGKRKQVIRWRAAIRVDGKPKHVGTFNSEIEAARAYDTAAKQFFGPFARLNFPEDQSTVPPVIHSSSQELIQCLPTDGNTFP